MLIFRLNDKIKKSGGAYPFIKCFEILCHLWSKKVLFTQPFYLNFLIVFGRE